MRQELKVLQQEKSAVQKRLEKAQREVRRCENQIDQLDMRRAEVLAGCRRGDVVRYTSGQLFFPHNQDCHIGDRLEVVVLGVMNSRVVTYHLRLLEEVVTYPREDDNQDVKFEGDPKYFWRHFTKAHRP